MGTQWVWKFIGDVWFGMTHVIVMISDMEFNLAMSSDHDCLRLKIQANHIYIYIYYIYIWYIYIYIYMIYIYIYTYMCFVYIYIYTSILPSIKSSWLTINMQNCRNDMRCGGTTHFMEQWPIRHHKKSLPTLTTNQHHQQIGIIHMLYVVLNLYSNLRVDTYHLCRKPVRSFGLV